MEKIKVLKFETGEYPKVVEIGDDIESLQAEVGGYAEMYCPFSDEVAIICNEEGKINGLPLNRVICDEDTMEPIEIIAGDFLIVGAPEDSDRFAGLGDREIEKYAKIYKYPEKFFKVNGQVVGIEYRPERERPDIEPER